MKFTEILATVANTVFFVGSIGTTAVVANELPEPSNDKASCYSDEITELEAAIVGITELEAAIVGIAEVRAVIAEELVKTKQRAIYIEAALADLERMRGAESFEGKVNKLPNPSP